jgi:hypothetical protein
MIGFACAWKKGCNDDLSRMTRAAYLWKNGEHYCWNEANQNWFPTLSPAPVSGCCTTGSVFADPTNTDGYDLHGAATATQDYQRRIRRDSRLLTVSIDIQAPSSASAVAFEFQVPQGWIFVEASDDGEWDGTSRKAKWGPFLAGLSRVVTLTLQPAAAPATVEGFVGTVSFDGVNQPVTVVRSGRGNTK